MQVSFRIGERLSRACLRAFVAADEAAATELLRRAPSAADWQQQGATTLAAIEQELGATPRWWLLDGRTGVASGLSFDVADEEQRGQALVLASSPLALGMLEDAFVCLCFEALAGIENASRYDVVRTYLLPHDGWALPALAALGGKVPIRGGFPTLGLGVVEITRFQLERARVERA